jgi:hypothetical protein
MEPKGGGRNSTVKEKRRDFIDRFMKKWGIMLKVSGFVLAILGVKVVIEYYELDLVAVSPLVTAFVGGVIFIIAILLAGTFSDYKESEKIPAGLATSVLTLYKDIRIASANDIETTCMQDRIRALLSVINSNFRNNLWKQTAVNSGVDKIDEDILCLVRGKTVPQFITRLRNEVANIDRISNRIETIKETTFIPAAYGVGELAVGAAILTLLFMKIDPYIDGIIIIGVISLILISLILLIRDMDHPFEVGKKTFADIDLSLMYKLEERLKNL